MSAHSIHYQTYWIHIGRILNAINIIIRPLGVADKDAGHVIKLALGGAAPAQLRFPPSPYPVMKR